MLRSKLIHVSKFLQTTASAAADIVMQPLYLRSFIP